MQGPGERESNENRKEGDLGLQSSLSVLPRKDYKNPHSNTALSFWPVRLLSNRGKALGFFFFFSTSYLSAWLPQVQTQTQKTDKSKARQGLCFGKSLTRRRRPFVAGHRRWLRGKYVREGGGAEAAIYYLVWAQIWWWVDDVQLWLTRVCSARCWAFCYIWNVVLSVPVKRASLHSGSSTRSTNLLQLLMLLLLSSSILLLFFCFLF